VEQVEITKTNSSLQFIGGYNSGFSARDGETIVNGYFRVNNGNSGSLTFDGFTVENTNSAGAIIGNSNDTNLTINNCKIHNTSIALYLSFAQNILISNNQLYDNSNYAVFISRPASSPGTTVVPARPKLMATSSRALLFVRHSRAARHGMAK